MRVIIDISIKPSVLNAMKKQFKLLVILSAISIGSLACKGSVNSGNAGTTPQDSIKTGRDVNIDTMGSQKNIVTDTSGKPTDTIRKKQ